MECAGSPAGVFNQALHQGWLSRHDEDHVVDDLQVDLGALPGQRADDVHHRRPLAGVVPARGCGQEKARVIDENDVPCAALEQPELLHQRALILLPGRDATGPVAIQPE